MHYVCKGESPLFFESEKKEQSFLDDPAWNNLHCKTSLRLYLMAEQNQCCIYCERSIDVKNSHIEHIVAQTKEEDRRFDYNNLVVSCNGDQCPPIVKAHYQPEDIQSCGHKKSDDLDSDKFLDPTAVSNIEQYFTYDKTRCALISSDKDMNKSSYTIQLLNLDNPRLNNERANARTALLKVLSSMRSSIDKKQKIRLILTKKERAFASFLKCSFKPFLL